MPASEPNLPAAAPWRAPRLVRMGGPLVFVGALVSMFLALAGIGLAPGVRATGGMIAAATAALGGLITPVLYMLGAFGLGRPLAAVLAPRSRTQSATPDPSDARRHLQLALGIGAMLWLSHAMGVMGLLSEAGPLGPYGSRMAAWGVVALGLVLLADQVARGDLRPERWPVFPPATVLWTPALALVLVAGASPPLGLWESEFGGYDALSYHLQLAKEWAAGPMGRIWPVEHNVYSFLPSYMESAFAHLGALSLGSTGPPTGGGAITRMLGGEAHWVHACQFLHAAMGLVSALLVARVVCLLGQRAGANGAIAAFGGIAGGALLLATPWTIVVGSLAYNELAMLAAAAGAFLAAAQANIGPWRRGVAAGWLVGIACSAKPTALLLVGPAVALALLAWQDRSRVRELVPATCGGTIAGLAAIGPWLVRNALASGGNPVFPFAASRLGHGHWTEEQAARYARAHTTDLSPGERLVLLFSPRGASHGVVTGQARGLGHEQWSIVPWIALVSLVIVLLWKPARRVGVVLWLGAIITVLCWGAFTHVQSRFLLPLLVPMAILFGLAACAVQVAATRRIRREPGDRPAGMPILAAAFIGVLPVTVAGWSAVIFMRQYQAQPNRLLVLGAGGLTGMLFEPSLSTATTEERASFFNEQAQPPVFVNLGMRERGRDFAPEIGEPAGVYLLGDAAPLYYLDALGSPRQGMTPSVGTVIRGAKEWSAVRVEYHTTWDRSPLGEAIAAAPGEPAAWTRWMRSHGFGFVLVNYPELARLIERDRNFDPRVTIASVRDWLGSSGVRSVRTWTVPADPGGRAQHVTSELFRLEGEKRD